MPRIMMNNGYNRIHDEIEANYFVRHQQNSQPDHVDAKITKERKALSEFRHILEDSILGNSLFGKPKKDVCPIEAMKEIQQLKNITLWGVPLLPSKGHQGTDVILMKFLKAKRFKVQEAFEMLRKTLKWRRDYKVDSILEEDFGPDIDDIMYLNCHDRQGHPLYFNVYEAFNNIALFRKLFKKENKYENFFRLKVQTMEKGLKELSFKPGGVHSMVHITDLKNSPRSGKKIGLVNKKALKMIRENYPDVIDKNIIINVPFWCYVCHTISSTFKTRRNRANFVYATPSKATKTLLKFISPEHLPVEYGGLNREDDEFFPEDKASELIVTKNSTGIIHIPVHEPGVTMIWDLTVVGWDVSYREEFVPDDEGSYRVLLHKGRERKREESIRNSFYINEPGKIVITIDNTTFKKKRVLYRFKTKPTVPMYIYFNK